MKNTKVGSGRDSAKLNIGARWAVRVAAAGLTAAVLGACAPVSEVEPNNTTATATALSIDVACYGTALAAINPIGDFDFFSFPVTAGDRLWMATDTGGTQNPGGTSRDSFLQLLDTDGTTLIESDDDDGVGNGADTTVESQLASAIAGRQATSTGSMFVRVNELGDNNGLDPYVLYVAKTTNAPIAETEANDTLATANPTPDNCDTPISGSIGAAGDVDYYLLDGPSLPEAGTTIFISVDADPERDGGTDLDVELRDGSDALVFEADSSTVDPGEARSFAYTLQTGGSGPFYLRIAHTSPAGTGTYQFLASPGSLYQFDPVFNADLNTLTTSNVAVAPTTGSISISAGGEYRVNGGAFTNVAGTVNFGDRVQVRLMSASTYSTETTVTLDVAGITADFDVTTLDPPTVSFTTASQTKSENVTPVTITVELDAPAQLEASIPFTIGGTATSPADYSIPTASPLIIPVGQSSASITVNVVNDPTDELDETVIATLGAPTNATAGALTVHTFTIQDNDQPPKVSFTAANQSHAESGAFTVTVKLSNPSAFAFDVPFSVGGTASGADRVVSTASPLTFNPGDTSKTINGTITSDPLDELDETVIFTLGEPTGDPTLGTPAVHTLNILDDDLSPRVTMIPLNQTVSEGVGTASITFQLDALSGLPVIVPLTYGGTAAAPGDYLAGPSSITIPAGDISSNLELTIVNNLVHETTEVIQIGAGGAAAGRRAVPTKGTITITDND